MSADDLMSLVPDAGAVPVQVGAILMLDVSAGLDPEKLLATFGRRLPAVPRLRQRLVRLPLGGGRPIWVDDPAFQIGAHVGVMQCPAPTGLEAVLAVAASLLTTRLPPDRPLWAATLVTDVGDAQAALILRFHHVLADGMAGLALLSGLVDGAPEVTDPAFPRPRPRRTQLVTDAARDTLRAVTRLPVALLRLAQATAAFKPSLFTSLAPSSLNRPTGPLRRFTTVGCELASVQAAAHAAGATVNDLILCAVTGALHHLLAGRGESVDTFVVSVPVSFRQRGAAQALDKQGLGKQSLGKQSLGNQSAVIPLRLPGVGEPAGRLRAVAGLTRAAKHARPGASNALLGPGFRLLAKAGLYQRFIDHQRLVHTFVTNLKGPETRLSLGGLPILNMMALTATSGNITVSFAALSYAGTLTVTLSADPETCPDLGQLQQWLRGELELLVGAGQPGEGQPGEIQPREIQPRESQGLQISEHAADTPVRH